MSSEHRLKPTPSEKVGTYNNSEPRSSGWWSFGIVWSDVLNTLTLAWGEDTSSPFGTSVQSKIEFCEAEDSACKEAYPSPNNVDFLIFWKKISKLSAASLSFSLCFFGDVNRAGLFWSTACLKKEFHPAPWTQIQ